MRVLVVSDTHIPTMAAQIPKQILDEASDCKLIVHAGDLVSKKVLDELSKFAPVHAVRGNMDLPQISPTLPQRQIIRVEGWRIGIVHGHEGHGQTTPERVRNTFASDEVDCIVFGHSHLALSESVGDTILFNPGSPVAGRGARRNSFGILELGNTIETRIVEMKS